MDAGDVLPKPLSQMACLVLGVLVVMSSQPFLLSKNCLWLTETVLPSRNKDILKDVPLPLGYQITEMLPKKL